MLHPRRLETRRGVASTVSSLAAALLLGVIGLGCVDASTEHRVRANAFLRGGDAASALKEIDLGLERKQDDPALLILRGKALFELDRMDDARDAYARAVASGKAKGEGDRTLAEAHLGLAMVGSRTKDWPAARKNFEALVGINDKDATSHLNVARACIELHDFECAVSHGELAGRLRGNDESVLYTLGNVYLNAGKLKEAELTFQHICEVVPAASSCPYGQALVAAKSGDKPRALTQLREAVTRKVPNPGTIATEPAFASLKDDPVFVELVNKATAGND
jgi:Flp pilus assembly protein TadD